MSQRTSHLTYLFREFRVFRGSTIPLELGCGRSPRRVVLCASVAEIF